MRLESRAADEGFDSDAGAGAGTGLRAGAETGADNGVDDTLGVGAMKTAGEIISADFEAAGTGRLGGAPEPKENGAKLAAAWL